MNDDASTQTTTLLIYDCLFYVSTEVAELSISKVTRDTKEMQYLFSILRFGCWLWSLFYLWLMAIVIVIVYHGRLGEVRSQVRNN